MGLIAEYGSSDESDDSDDEILNPNTDSNSSEDKKNVDLKDEDELQLNESGDLEIHSQNQQEDIETGSYKNNHDIENQQISPYITFPDDFGTADTFEIERLKLRALTQPQQMPTSLSMDESLIDEPDNVIEEKISKLLELKRSGKASLNENLANNNEYNRPGFVNGQLASLLENSDGFTQHQSSINDYSRLPEEGYVENLITASNIYKKNRTKIDFVQKSD